MPNVSVALVLTYYMLPYAPHRGLGLGDEAESRDCTALQQHTGQKIRSCRDNVKKTVYALRLPAHCTLTLLGKLDAPL